MKAKKIASLACAFLLACSACPVNVHAALEVGTTIDISGTTYYWTGQIYRPVVELEVDTAVLESKEDIVIDEVNYSFKEIAGNQYIYEATIDGVTYITSVSGFDNNGLFDGIVLCTNVPKDIVIDGISYSFYLCDEDIPNLSSRVYYKSIIDGIPHIILVNLDSGEVLSNEKILPETFVDESTGITYSLVDEYDNEYVAVVDETTYLRYIYFDGDTNNDITINGMTYPVYLTRPIVMIDGIYYIPHELRYIYGDDREDAVTYVYEYDYSRNVVNPLEEIDFESLLLEIDGIPVITGRMTECEYLQTYLGLSENSDIMTFEDEIESSTVKGDATGDGKVDISDVVFANKATLGKTALSQEQAEALDIDGDGIVSTTDALSIMKYVVKLVDSL